MSERLGKFSAGFLTLVAGLCAAPAIAQDFTAGKTAAQLFASDCSTCHKSPAGLAKGQSVSSLTSFLREHYTTKTESAAALAAYLASPGNARATPPAAAAGGPKAAEEKPASRSRPAATATAEPEKQPDNEASAPAPSRETTKPPVDPVVAKLNSYAAARGEPKDTVRAAAAARKLDSYANAASGAEGVTSGDRPNAKPKPGDKKKRDTTGTMGDTTAAHPPRPRRAQAPIVQPPPGNN